MTVAMLLHRVVQWHLLKNINTKRISSTKSTSSEKPRSYLREESWCAVYDSDFARRPNVCYLGPSRQYSFQWGN